MSVSSNPFDKRIEPVWIKAMQTAGDKNSDKAFIDVMLALALNNIAPQLLGWKSASPSIMMPTLPIIAFLMMTMKLIKM